MPPLDEMRRRPAAGGGPAGVVPGDVRRLREPRLDRRAGRRPVVLQPDGDGVRAGAGGHPGAVAGGDRGAPASRSSDVARDDSTTTATLAVPDARRLRAARRRGRSCDDATDRRGDGRGRRRARSPATVEDDPRTDCYGETEATAAAAASRRSSTPARSSAAFVPWYLRFPECGLAEIAWSGDYYSLPDAEFVALVEEVAPCFQAAGDRRRGRGDRPAVRDGQPRVPRGPQLVHRRPTRPTSTPSTTASWPTDGDQLPVMPARRPSRVSSSTAPNSVCTSPAASTTTSAGWAGMPKRSYTAPGSSLICGNVSPWRSMNVLELGVGARPGDADEVDLPGPALRGRLDRGGFRLQIVQYGAQNHSARSRPA